MQKAAAEWVIVTAQLVSSSQPLPSHVSPVRRAQPPRPADRDAALEPYACLPASAEGR